jgi:Rieske Fe-S protein
VTRNDPEHAGSPCSGCDVGRRAFLRDAALAVAAIGVAGSRAAAMPIRAIDAIARHGESVTYPIPAADGVNIDKKNDTMVARVGGKLFVFARTCPHQNTALKWLDKDKRFQCPKHDSKYTPEGVFIEGRATRSLDRFAVRKEGNTVVADLDKLYEEDKAGAEWKAAFITL